MNSALPYKLMGILMALSIWSCSGPVSENLTYEVVDNKIVYTFTESDLDSLIADSTYDLSDF
jgi:hypothetical protein